MFLNAPPLETPALFKVSASAPMVIPPESSNAAPDATVTPPAIVPKAVLLLARMTPAEMVVEPV